MCGIGFFESVSQHSTEPRNDVTLTDGLDIPDVDCKGAQPGCTQMDMDGGSCRAFMCMAMAVPKQTITHSHNHSSTPTTTLLPSFMAMPGLCCFLCVTPTLSLCTHF